MIPTSFRWLIMFFLALAPSVRAQLITGTVRDAATKKPLAFANVFVNNTTIGTVTDPKGSFVLKKIQQPGTYELVVSFVGYEPFKSDVTLRMNETLIADVNLIPSEIELDNIEVKATRDEAWERKRKRFERIFLGDDKLAAACKIVNPWVIDFPEEKIIEKFIAKANAPIEIENFALGYKVMFYMNAFSADQTSYFISGNVQFEELHTPDAEEAAYWRNNRRLAYLRSNHHLFKAIINRRIQGEGFRLYTERAGYESALMRSQNFSTDLKQTLTALDTATLLVMAFQNETYRISFNGRIEVHYVKEKARVRTYRDVPYPVSWIKFNRGSVVVNKDGYELNPAEVIISGAMTNDRVASMLPINYQPGKADTLLTPVPVSDKELEPFREQVYVHTDKPYYYPGERMWLKGYMNYGDFDLRDSLSSTAYVEILHPRKKIVLTKTVEVVNGVFFGDFDLPDSLSPGTYGLRAYTNFSRNFGDENLYVKPLPILGAVEKVDAAQGKWSVVQDSSLVVRQEKPRYKQRERVNLSLRVKNKEGEPIGATLSVSVTDARLVVPFESSKTILEDFPLKKPGKETSDGNSRPLEYGINFSGQFYNNKGKPEKATLHVVQLAPPNFTIAHADEKGQFAINGLVFYDTVRFSIQGHSEKGVSYGRAEVLSRKTPSPDVNLPAHSIRTEGSERVQRVKEDFELPFDSKLLEEITIKATRLVDTRVERPYGKPDYVLKAKDINTSYGNLLVTLPGKIPGLIVRMVNNDGQDPHWVVYLQRMVSISNPAEVLVTVNDNFVAGRPGDILAAIDPATVESIEVKTGTNVLYGSYGGNGIVAVYTTKGGLVEGASQKGGLRTIQVVGYSTPNSFRAPQYSNPDIIRASADSRSTLYWNPDVVTDETGHAVVSFYASDMTGRYRIVVEGVTLEGKPLRYSGFIEVGER